ncbi:hypothetical protein [Idiomarina aminovorans]|uniref:hypothetical protein n=1 Tax=Idiomarina aminovorans TaxID=2914829 RepID=UPI0020068E35|nr:hypothetical protein [Idiomarina sp. ATCH4]MCK7458467.1 hypothetical protein [Idiomarina sp. ATCH4]
MKNKMMDLHNHLFAQLERLSDEDLKEEELNQELKRADAVSKVSMTIVKNAEVCLKAERMRADGLIENSPEMLGVKNDG